MIKRITLAGALLTACFCSNLRAQTTNAPETATNAVAAATTNAAPADTAPKPDPAGTATGAASDAAAADGTTFVPPTPAVLVGDDLKDTNKVATFTAAKKAADDYAAQA